VIESGIATRTCTSQNGTLAVPFLHPDGKREVMSEKRFESAFHSALIVSHVAPE
jgi:hypothetical protein